MMKKLISIIAIFALSSVAAFAQMPTFNTVYNGYGLVNVWNNSVELKPKVATSSNETHAGLVVSNTTYNDPYEMRFTVENVSQLRNGTPNAWEAPWVVFGYKDVVNSRGEADQTFTYVNFKPNGYGLELGEALTLDEQNFLWTSNVGSESFDIGESYNIVVRVQSGRVKVFVDGREAVSFKDETQSRLSLNGKIGFYSEDAHVKFTNINVVDLSNEDLIREISTGTASSTMWKRVDNPPPAIPAISKRVIRKMKMDDIKRADQTNYAQLNFLARLSRVQCLNIKEHLYYRGMYQRGRDLDCDI